MAAFGDGEHPVYIFKGSSRVEAQCKMGLITGSITFQIAIQFDENSHSTSFLQDSPNRLSTSSAWEVSNSKSS